MRIESFNQVSQIYQKQQITKAQATSQARAKDHVQISSFGQDIQTAKAALREASDIREELVAPIKAKVANGTYSVDNGSFAEKLLAKYEEMR